MENSVDIEVFYKDLLVVPNCINWINKNIERKYWKNQKVREKFAKRSANKIAEEGDVFFMNPCLDYILLARRFFDSLLLDSKLVAQEIFTKKYEIYHMHFALEFVVDNQKYFIDFSKMNQVILGKGNFVNVNEDVKVIQTFKTSGKIDHDKNIFENFPGYVSKLRYYKMEKQLERMLKDNSLEKFDEFRKELGKNKDLSLFVY